MKKGFTLLEGSASLSLLAILAFVLLEILDGVQRGERTSTARIDAADQAAFVFDRFASDLSALPARIDAPLVFRTSPKTELRLAASVKGFGSDRRFSVISYSLLPSIVDEDRIVLQRSATALAWNAAGLLGVNDEGNRPLLNPWPSGLKPGDDDYEVLGEGIIHMIFGFKLREKVESQPRGSVIYSPPLRSDGGVDLSKIAGLEMNLLVLDVKTIRNLTPAQVDSIRAQFPTPPPGNSAFVQWRSIADDPERFQTEAPLAARNLRVFARSFDLPNPQL